jgi:formylmethanofuran dehydrogenase subunit E
MNPHHAPIREVERVLETDRQPYPDFWCCDDCGHTSQTTKMRRIDGITVCERCKRWRDGKGRR